MRISYIVMWIFSALNFVALWAVNFQPTYIDAVLIPLVEFLILWPIHKEGAEDHEVNVMIPSPE